MEEHNQLWSTSRLYTQSTQSLVREHGFEDLRIEGELPTDLQGTLYRAGPFLYESFGQPYSHPFEADGGIMAARIGGGRAQGAARIVQSEGLLEERAAGKPFYGSAAPWLKRIASALQQKVKNTANTSILSWQGRLFGLMEAATPTEVDPETLETLGATDLDGLIPQAFSAHPRHCPARKSIFNLGLSYGRQNTLDLFGLPETGRARRVTTLELPYATLVHDFAITDKHAIFLISPAVLQLWRAILQVGGFADLFRWEPERGSELIVVPLDEPSKVRRIQVDAFWVWHFANAFEQGGDIVLDMCHYKDLNSLDAIGGDELTSPSALVRGRISKNRFTTEVLTKDLQEFPSASPLALTKENKHTWMQGPNGLGRFDHERGEQDLWNNPNGQLASEPVFVPRPKAAHEGEGWVLSLILDGPSNKSFLGVFDAMNMAGGPRAKLWFDQRIPLTFHGQFVA